MCQATNGNAIQMLLHIRIFSYLLDYSPHLHAVIIGCEVHKCFLILTKRGSSGTSVARNMILFLVFLLRPALSLAKEGLALQPTADLTVYYEALCPDSIKFVGTISRTRSSVIFLHWSKGGGGSNPCSNYFVADFV